MNPTISYYNQNAQSFIETTQNVEFTSTQDAFLEYLAPGAFILDFGCGSGRDSLYFSKRGFRVDAVDGSDEMCRLASEHTGLNVRQMLFQELDEVNTYDGIWACASLLHVNRNDLPDVLGRLYRLLTKTGILYASFKYGTGEKHRGDRYFYDLTGETLTDLLTDSGFNVLEIFLTWDVREDRKEEKWVNAIARK